MSGRILVTGGAGFIGSHLVDALVARGERVTVLDDFSVGLRENLLQAERAGEVRTVSGSIGDAAAVRMALEGCDRVYHLAVQCVRRSLGRPLQSHDVNATGTLIVLEEARCAQISRFVYCSSSEVYGNASTGLLDEDHTVCRPMTVYGAAKLAGELYAEAYWRTYRLPTVVVRPFNAYGPRAYQHGTRAEVLARFVGRALNGLPPVVFGDGNNGRDFTYVTEVARGVLQAGEADRLVGDKVNIAYGRMVTVREVAETVLRTLGRNDLAVDLGPPRPGDVHQLHGDTTKAERMLGYKAGIAFEDGVRRYIDWVKAEYPDPAALAEREVVNWSLPESK
jgi:UDP-glucose 4-epimerase